MEFAHKVQLDCYQRVVTLMRELFGEQIRTRDDLPMIGLVQGSAFTETGVWPWGDSEAVISTRAFVVREVEITPDLMHYLLRKNDKMRFGAFGLAENGAIFFEHAILGSTCTKEELRASVLAVSQTADLLDEEITARWGGQRAFD
jgi:hypothetical protein